MPRPRLAFLRSFVDDVADARRRARRRRHGRGTEPAGPDRPTSEELARRLDETRERLRRDIPPRGDED